MPGEFYDWLDGQPNSSKRYNSQENNLEKDVLNYLKTLHVLALLKVDGLVFDQVYADLMVLMKSNQLSKKYLDMNPHYLELSQHLELLVNSPRLSLDPSIKVLKSELRLSRRTKGSTTDYTRIPPQFEPVCIVMMTLTKSTPVH